MPRRSISGLPDLPAIANRSGTPNAAMQRDVERFLALSQDVYPSSAHKSFEYTPESASDLVERYKQTPEPFRTVGHEALVQLRELFDNNFRDEQGRTAWGHQVVNLTDRFFSLWAGEHPPESFLYDGEANSGKTWQLAQEMRWVIHGQMRDVVKGVLVFMHAKPYHMGPHLYDEQGLLRRHRAQPSLGRVELFLARLSLRQSEAVHPSITPDACIQIMRQCGHSTEKALEKLRDLCRGESDEKVNGSMRQIAIFLTGNGIEVRRKLPKGRMIELSSESEDAENNALEELGGDAGCAIPSAYIENNQVLIWDPRMNEVADGRNDLLVNAATNAKVIILPMTAITNAGSRQQLAALLGGNVSWVLADEALRLNGTDVARRGMAREHQYADSLTLPPCAAATNRQQHSSFKAVTRRNTIGELIESHTLGSFGVRIGPDSVADHYPTDSVEYLREALRMYFAQAPLPESYALSQPWERNGLVVTHPRLVWLFSQLLDEAYQHLHPNLRAQIIPMTSGINCDPNDVGGILTAMNDVRRDGPNVLVTSAQRIKDSAHLGRIRTASIFTRASTDGLWGVFSRLLHNTDHREKQKPGFRTYLQILQGSDANTYETPFSRVTKEHEVQTDLNGRISWVDFQALLSVAQYKKDQKRIHVGKTRFPSITIPRAESDTSRTRDLVQVSGTMLVERKMYGDAPHVPCTENNEITELEMLRQYGLYTDIKTFLESEGPIEASARALATPLSIEQESDIDDLIDAVDMAIQTGDKQKMRLVKGECERTQVILNMAPSKNTHSINMLDTAIRTLSINLTIN